MEEKWKQAKVKYPIGSNIKGTVIESMPFGLFIDIGYGNHPSKKLTGIIDIVASKSLPKDTNDWPRIGDIIEGKVFSFRENSKEIDLKLIRVCNSE